MKKSKLRIDWYQAVYATKDEKLIREFWYFYNTHRLSKNRAARCVLIHYYSTTAECPEFIIKLLCLRRTIRKAKWNYYDPGVPYEM